ncbi:MAG: hypothetical protein IJ484_06160, partial [Oscillospiraceae bacterium]|nr:hypothetical protein [Oscillospiraceae bacterium]
MGQLSQMELVFLQALKNGSRIEATRTDGSTVTATVMMNDGTTLALMCDDGSIQFLKYADIQKFSLPAAGAQSAPPQPEPPAPQTKKPAAPQPPAKPAFWTEPGNLRVSDGTLKEWYSELPAPVRKELQGAFDSFMGGVRGNDRGKQEDAARRMRGILARDPELSRHEGAARLAGHLLLRSNQKAGEVFAAGGCLYECACMEFGKKKERDAAHMGALAAAALRRGEREEQTDVLFTLLAIACEETDDLSVLPWLVNQPAGHREALADWLAARGKSGSGGMCARAKELAGGQAPDAPKHAPEQPEPAAEAPPAPERSTGVLLRLRWSQERGYVKMGDRELFFDYSEVTDPELRRMIDQRVSIDPEKQRILVTWCGAGPRPTDVRLAPVDEPAARLQDARRRISTGEADKLAEAAGLLEGLMDTDKATQALEELLGMAGNRFRKDGDREALARVLEVYQANRQHMPKQSKPYENLMHIHMLLEDYPGMCALADGLLASPDLPAGPRGSYLNRYSGYVMRRYTETGDPALLDKALAMMEEWEELYQTSPDARSNIGARATYRDHLLPRMGRCLCLMGRLEEAGRCLADMEKQNSPAEKRADLREMLDEARRKARPEPPAPLQPEPAPAQPEPDP